MACNIACLRTVCSSRMFPGQEYCFSRSMVSGATSVIALPISALKQANIIFHQERDVVAAVAQGGQEDRVAVQAVRQVGAERSAGHHGVQIAVRCGDNANVRLDRLISADSLEFLLLNCAENLALHQKRHVAHFVEEEGAAVALLELSDPLAHGPGKSPFFVAEEFAFQERFGNCGTVDGKEFLCRPDCCADGSPERRVPCPSRSRRG